MHRPPQGFTPPESQRGRVYSRPTVRDHIKLATDRNCRLQ